MLKRGVPFTPEPAVTTGKLHKKNRQYQSPLVLKTPLRNAISPKGKLEEIEKSTPQTPLNDDEKERKANRVALIREKHRMKKNLMSPALPTTPQAKPPTFLTPNGSKKEITMAANSLTPNSINTDVVGKPIASIKMTAEQRTKMFEEWMKIASDNKINAKNSWNVALIDYFSELTFLRDGDSINFQKASCTLDGCVKIYATRVDSVADETGKLLNGLSEGKKLKFAPDLMEDTNAIINKDGEDDKKIPPPSRRPHKAVDTLENSFEPLNLKNFELECFVDPLFKKACSDFDESGSKGYLTSNLSINSNGYLMFDTTDHVIRIDSIDNSRDFKDDNLYNSEIDFMPIFEKFGKQLSDLDGKSITPSLSQYSFESTNLKQLNKTISETLSKLAELNVAMDIESDEDEPINDGSIRTGFDFGLAAVDDPTDNQEIFHYEEAPINDDYFTYDDNNIDDLPVPLDINNQQPQTSSEVTVYRDIVDDGTSSSSSFFAYFDSKFQKNWAGPEHWKINRPHLRRAPLNSETDLSKPKKSTKKDFVIDFMEDPVDITTIFVKANPATITLSKTTLDERNSKDNLLPEDLHFSSSELLKLFIKPSWHPYRRTTVATSTVIPPDNSTQSQTSQELQPSFWALPPTVEVQPENTMYFGNTEGDDVDHDYYDDIPIPEAADPSDPNANHSQGVISIGENFVPTYKSTNNHHNLQFSRKAKKVDVQELKRVLWEEIESIQKISKPNEKDDLSSPVTNAKTSFSDLIKGLDGSTLSKETRQDVSVSYCFICLLHLANEHNLELHETSEDILSQIDRATVARKYHKLSGVIVMVRRVHL